MMEETHQPPADTGSGARHPALVVEEATEVYDPAAAKAKIWAHVLDMDPATERPRPTANVEAPNGGAPAQPAPAPKAAEAVPSASGRAGTIPALRVAVLATSAPGEVRLIALGAADEAPPGAALAVLVPLSAADGDAVRRLFGGLE
jgi:hypothetical protein